MRPAHHHVLARAFGSSWHGADHERRLASHLLSLGITAISQLGLNVWDFQGEEESSIRPSSLKRCPLADRRPRRGRGTHVDNPLALWNYTYTMHTQPVSKCHLHEHKCHQQLCNYTSRMTRDLLVLRLCPRQGQLEDIFGT